MSTDSLEQLKSVKLELAEMLQMESPDVAELQRLVTRYRILIPASYEQLKSELDDEAFAEMVRHEQSFLEIIQGTVQRSQKDTKSTLLKLSKGRKAKNAY
ncbi:MAG: hypothetical protein CMF12_09675 [Idiomarina sp.]|uniref:hypothetical protein n=1 Tax=Idiomarina sp. TaxID=1874361 RepID=UPI000C5C9A04|nr:hypothetical protein [Idiomarina sp.]MBT42782.1 hypothetical protein [Idiomarina sp.]